MPRPPRLLLLASVLCAAGCGGRLPVPSFPQLQEVGEIGEYGTQRLRASDACRGASASVEDYVSCMERRGWTFIERGGVYPAPECWTRRTAADPLEPPPAQCFHRSSAAPHAAPRAPVRY